MKTQIGFLAACFLLAGVLMVPQAAHAQLVLTPPCTAASLSGGFGYELRGTIGGLLFVNNQFNDVRNRVGLLNFDGAGHFIDTYSESASGPPAPPVGFPAYVQNTRQNVTQGTYTISSDCTRGTLIMHGNTDQPDCVHVAVAFGPTAVFLGTLFPPPAQGLSVFVTDAALTCTDSDSEIPNPNPLPPPQPEYVSTYTGTMTQQ